MDLSLAIAIAILAIYVYVYIKLTPHEALANLEVIPIWRHIQIMLRKTSFVESALADQKFFTDGSNMARFIHRGSWGVFVADADAMKQVFDNTITFPKYIPAEHNPNSALAQFMGVNVLDSNHEVWRRHRKMVAGPFKSQFNTKAFVELALDMTSIFEKTDGKNIDIHSYIQKLTIDALGVSLLGIDFGSLKSAEAPFITAYNRFTRDFLSSLYLLLPFLDTPANPFRKQVYDDINHVETYLTDLISQRRKEIATQKEISRKDLLALMIQAGDEEDIKFTDKELRDNIMIFFIAGHDTTASSILYTMFLLACNPEAQEKVREEVLRELGPDPTVVPDNEALKNLEYTTAVIKETLRLYPSLGLIPERIASKDTVLQGQRIPKDTVLVMSPFFVHRNPKYWESPNEFRPTRFLNNANSFNSKHLPWFPFGGGSRQCLGMNFSYLEQKVVLSTVLRKFRIQLPEGFDPKASLEENSSSILSPKRLKLDFVPL